MPSTIAADLVGASQVPSDGTIDGFDGRLYPDPETGCIRPWREGNGDPVTAEDVWADLIAAGPIWRKEQIDHLGTSRTGLVFTWEDGSLINPARLSTRFRQHCVEARLPPIRLHDVRHSYASAG